jgi:transcriptional regulator with XRE-family HTH domain
VDDGIRTRGLQGHKRSKSAGIARLSRPLAGSGDLLAELARRLGSTRGHVTQLLAGERNLTLGTIAEIAHALGCTVELRVAADERSASFRSHHVEVPGEGGTRRPPRRASVGARR